MRHLKQTDFNWVLLLVLVTCLVLPSQASEMPWSESGEAGSVVLLPDLTEIRDLHTLKLRFFRFLLPVVQAENRRLIETRHRLDFIHDHIRFQREVPPGDLIWLAGILEEFDIVLANPADPTFWRRIRMKVDLVPEELVLVQAALESGWGTSRFARQGNNLFGQWCFSPDCGIVPEDRPEGEAHEVACFESIAESVAAYMQNLNTGLKYRTFREIRGKMRREGQEPDPVAVAEGLYHYSEGGNAYVQTIRSMLRHNADVISEARGLLAALKSPVEWGGS